MAKRSKVGIIYNYDENWIGGTYYIENMIRSLNFLAKEDQLVLDILAKDKTIFKNLAKVTKYSKLKFSNQTIRHNKIKRLINFFSGKLSGREVFKKKIKFDVIFPLFDVQNQFKHVKKIIFWIPDLQEKYLPNFFSVGEIQARNGRYEEIIKSNHTIVFSSNTAMQDFMKFYPHATNDKKILRFAVVHPTIEQNLFNEIAAKYRIIGEYFIAPNQFWQHKNHIAIIEAVKILRDKNVKVKIVFTGKENDYRNPNYTDFLKEKVTSYGLDNQILFLGFIDRNEQLLLMKNAVAIIQPSLFEGWSTVVEDAKALNQTLIVSNIEVHKEQLADKAYYFDPSDSQELSTKMQDVFINPSDKIKYDIDYKVNIEEFAQNFRNLTYNQEDIQ
ncbi:glycosyltransferase family 4 protein [Flavobacterium sp. K77]|uniref:glycosyltransferase family 4 protein n=1 Tax=Flavobacterium sp. K77 TaxID=2910676 RepID=UPI001F3EE44B|nr:glycosyltransferase family 1 protein [Flavobacterium sp. K77]MCF6141389.1 glycosyltransferase family 4 protein [Flavobacterium sp. K77]